MIPGVQFEFSDNFLFILGFMKYLLTLLVLVALTFEGQAQFFNPNNALVINKENRRRPVILFNNMKVKCRLNDGQKVKGDLLVHNNHIEIGLTKVQLEDIDMIKRSSWPWVRGWLQSTGLSIVTGEALDVPRGYTAGFVGLSAIFFGGRLLLFDPKYQPDNGWKMAIVDLSQIRQGVTPRTN